MGYWESYYHLIWATKERNPIIDEAGEALIRGSFQDTCRNAEAIVRAIGVMPDHIHLIVSIPPKWSVSNLVRELKVSATHLINASPNLTYAGSFAWQHEFGMFTFGRGSLQDVVHYVENQREHHAEKRVRPMFERIDRRDHTAL